MSNKFQNYVCRDPTHQRESESDEDYLKRMELLLEDIHRVGREHPYYAFHLAISDVILSDDWLDTFDADYGVDSGCSDDCC